MLMENNQASIYDATCTVQKIINTMKAINTHSKVMYRLQTLAALLNDIAQTRRGSDPRSFIDDSIILSEDYESGNEVDWTSVLNLIVNFHTEMGEWIGSH